MGRSISQGIFLPRNLIAISIFLLASCTLSPSKLSPSSQLEEITSTLDEQRTHLSTYLAQLTRQPLEDTATPTRRPTSPPRPTSTPRWEHNISAGNFPSVPAPDPSQSYTLAPPDPEQLVTLLYQNWISYEAVRFGPHDDPYFDEAAWKEARAIERHVAADFRRYYPYGIPNGSQYVRTYFPDWKNIPYYPASGFLELIKAGIVQYLNEENVRFLPEQSQNFGLFNGFPMVMELDGDPDTEWFVEFEFEDYDILICLPLDYQSDVGYVALPSDLDMIELATSNSSAEIDITHDLTGDGLAEVVVAYRYYFAGGLRGYIDIYSWDGNRLDWLDNVDLPGVLPLYGERYESEYTIDDFDGNGQDEIRIVWPRFAMFGCSWQTAFTYPWENGQFAQHAAAEDIPDIPECYAAKALYSHDPREQSSLYRAAISHLTSAGGSTDLIAWVRLQLATSLAGQGRDDEAIQILEILRDTDEEGEFLQAIHQTIQEEGLSTDDVCRSLYNAASELSKSRSSFGSDIDAHLSYQGYPISHEPEPFKVCPYWELMKNRIKVTSFSGNSDPFQALIPYGYQLTLARSINIDGDPDLEWIGIIEVEKPLVVILNRSKTEWELYPVDFLDGKPFDLSASGFDIDGDNRPETLAIFTFPILDDYWDDATSCMPDTLDYRLVVINSLQEGAFLWGDRTFSCQTEPPVDLSTTLGKTHLVELVEECNRCDLINDYAQPPGPDWYELTGLSVELDESENIFDYIDHLAALIIQGENLENVRTDLSDLIDFLASINTPKIVMDYLQYLFGLSYEVGGMEPQAVEEYLSLIETSPTSAWSWLAWSRLKTK